MDETKCILWILLAFIFSFISWIYGDIQIFSFGVYPLSITEFLFVLWVAVGLRMIFKHAHVSGILQNAKWIIQCLLGTYWCKEKGWWIMCSRDCAKCSIQTKRRITLWEARLFCFGYGVCLFIAFIIGAYIIHNPEAMWELLGFFQETFLRKW